MLQVVLWHVHTMKESAVGKCRSPDKSCDNFHKPSKDEWAKGKTKWQTTVAVVRACRFKAHKLLVKGVYTQCKVNTLKVDAHSSIISQRKAG